MPDRRVVDYWAGVFDVSPEALATSGTRVVPNAGKVARRRAAWVFQLGRSCLISAPPALVADLERKAADRYGDALLSPEGIANLFGDLAERTVGPAYQGHIAANDFRPSPSPRVCRLAAEDRDAVAALATLPDWEDCGLAADAPELYGSFAGGELVSVAGVIHWDASVVNVGVLTLPGRRQQGHARAAASAAIRSGLDRGHLVLWQTLEANRPAVRLAESLGSRQYARHVFVALGST